MIVTREERDGFITCGRSRIEFGDCPGYTSAPCRLIVETVARTFGDAHGDTSDPYFPIPSVSHDYLHTLDGEPPTCPHCGAMANLSLEPRPTYLRLSESGPDALLERADRERTRAAREHAVAAAGERQAAALEKLAAGAQPGETEQLREALRRRDEQIDQLLAGLNESGGNGHDKPEQRPSDVAPRPRRKGSS